MAFPFPDAVKSQLAALNNVSGGRQAIPKAFALRGVVELGSIEPVLTGFVFAVRQA